MIKSVIQRTKTAAHLVARRLWPHVSDQLPLNADADGCFLPFGYESRQAPKYFDDLLPETTPKIYQPDVYLLAAMMARCTGRRIIDVGCGKGYKLCRIAAGNSALGIDFGANIDYCKRTYPDREWREADFDSGDPLPLDDTEAARAVVVCADVIEHLRDPRHLLASLKRLVDSGAVLLLSTPERRLLRGNSDLGPPRNPAHVREWTLGELRALLGHAGLPVVYLGLTANNHIDRQMITSLAICCNGPTMGCLTGADREEGAESAPLQHQVRAA